MLKTLNSFTCLVDFKNTWVDGIIILIMINMTLVFMIYTHNIIVHVGYTVYDVEPTYKGNTWYVFCEKQPQNWTGIKESQLKLFQLHT